MKRILLSAGLVAAGTASVPSVLADDATIPAPSPKIWSVGASLRGFYDSNYSVNENVNHDKGSYGLELSPTVALNQSLQQTDFGIRYTYGLYWYNQRQIMGEDAIDQTHQLDLWFDHAFNERWKLNVSDTLGVGQEPEIIGGGGVPYRVNGNNLGNHLNVDLDTQWTRQLSTVLHYQNNFYDYQNSGSSVVPNPPPAPPGSYSFSSNNGGTASLAGLLNRDENTIGSDVQWHFDPETMAFIGYSFEWVDYLGQEPIAVVNVPPGFYTSSSRDTYNHQFHAGVQHNFTENLSATASAGAIYTDNYNNPSSANNSDSWAPYANVSVTYTYLPGDYAQLGFTQNNSASYVGNVAANGSITQYQESSVLYGSLTHHLTEKLIASAIGQFGYSTFTGGPEYTPDKLYTVGLNLSYIINQYLSADAGYNYDHLISSVPGAAYERNRYYIGLTATY